MSQPKPMREWPCDPQIAKAFEELDEMKIQLQKRQDELQQLVQKQQLKFTEAWNVARESIGNLGKEDEQAVYGACHLSFNAEKKIVLAWEKGKCPICDQEAQDAIKNLNSGQGMGILVSGGGPLPPQHQGGAADPSEDAMRKKRRGGRLFGNDDKESN